MVGDPKEEVMEKLSHILPTNRRISNVDLANGAPVRPGAPSFGRPIGLSAKIRQERLDAAKALKAAEEAKNSKLNVKDSVSISSGAGVKEVSVPISNTNEALTVASKVAGAVQNLSAVSPVEVKTSQKAPSSVIAPIDIVEDQLEAQVQKGKKVKTETKVASYPQATRDLLNQTSIMNQLVNDMPTTATEIAQREDEEV